MCLFILYLIILFLTFLLNYITGISVSVEKTIVTEQNDDQGESCSSTTEVGSLENDLGTIDSDGLEEEMFADSQTWDEIEEEEDFSPNDHFCFSECDFLEARTKMNKAKRHTGSYNQAWKEI